MCKKLKALLAMLLMCCCLTADWVSAQQRAADRAAGGAATTGNGSISGRVLLQDQPLAGVTVLLFVSGVSESNQKAPQKTVTDARGGFRFTRVAAGSYTVKSVADNLSTVTYVSVFGQVMPISDVGKTVHISTGEAIEGVELIVQRGCVISGRVLDANGQPLIEERINVIYSYVHKEGGERDSPNRGDFLNPAMTLTDDQGNYRLYGLPAGSYAVSIGLDSSEKINVSASFGKVIPETYHPGVTEREKATFIELKEGEEATGIDITVGAARLKGYAVSGRVIDAETGAPVAGVICEYRQHNQWTSPPVAGGRAVSNADGEFLIKGVMSGRYETHVTSDSEYYSDSTAFNVMDKDVQGVEIKLHRGAVLSGTVIVEGDKPNLLAPLLPIMIATETKSSTFPSKETMETQVEPDGSFRLNGVRPGRVAIEVRGNPYLWLYTIAQGANNVTDGLTVKAGDRINDLWIVVGSGSGVIRGQVELTNMEWSSVREKRAHAFLKTKYGKTKKMRYSGVSSIDKNGRFFISGVPAGEFVVSINLETDQFPDYSEEQEITVTKGKDAEIKFVVTIKKPDGDKDG